MPNLRGWNSFYLIVISSDFITTTITGHRHRTGIIRAVTRHILTLPVGFYGSIRVSITVFSYADYYSIRIYCPIKFLIIAVFTAMMGNF